MTFEEYKNLPKWKGKIFMKDEITCFNDGFEAGAIEATKKLQEKKTCWKECEYANPKAEIIQSYISEKGKVKELQEEKERLCGKFRTRIADLEKQIEEMKSDARGNLRFAEHSNNEIMRQKMCSMLLQWESRYK